jgi:hypothetical protein
MKHADGCAWRVSGWCNIDVALGDARVKSEIVHILFVPHDIQRRDIIVYAQHPYRLSVHNDPHSSLDLWYSVLK